MCALVMKHRKWSNCDLSTCILGLLEAGKGMQRPCWNVCCCAVLIRYSVMPGMNCWITEYGISSAITDNICWCVSQLLAFWYVSAKASRYLWSAEVWGVMHRAASTDCELFSACYNDAGFPGEMTSNEATTASFAFEMRTFLVRTLNWSQPFLGWLIFPLPLTLRNSFNFKQFEFDNVYQE